MATTSTAGLLVRGLRRRGLRLRRRRLPRIHGGEAPQPAHRRHGRHPGRQGLLAGRGRRWRVRLRRRDALRLDREHPLEQADRGHDVDDGRQGLLVRRLRRRGFAYGDAGFHGSAGATPLNEPIAGILRHPTTGATCWWRATEGSSPTETLRSTGVSAARASQAWWAPWPDPPDHAGRAPSPRFCTGPGDTVAGMSTGAPWAAGFQGGRVGLGSTCRTESGAETAPAPSVCSWTTWTSSSSTATGCSSTPSDRPSAPRPTCWPGSAGRSPKRRSSNASSAVGRSHALRHRTHLRPADRLGHQFEPRYREAFERELTPVDGIVEVLDAITVAICVASSGSHDKMAFTLGRTGLYDRFAGRIFSADEVANGKPAPMSSCTRLAGWPPNRPAAWSSRTAPRRRRRDRGRMRVIAYAGGVTPPTGWPATAWSSSTTCGRFPGSWLRLPDPDRVGKGPSGSAQGGPEASLDRSDEACPQCADLLVGQCPVEGAEPKVVGQTPGPGDERVAPVDVEQLDRLEQVTPDRGQGGLDTACRNLLGDHEGQVDVGRREPADRGGLQRAAGTSVGSRRVPRSRSSQPTRRGRPSGPTNPNVSTNVGSS